MTPTLYILLGLLISAITLAALSIINKTKHSMPLLPDPEELKRLIQRAEQQHKPRRHLRKMLVEGVRREILGQ